MANAKNILPIKNAFDRVSFGQHSGTAPFIFC